MHKVILEPEVKIPNVVLSATGEYFYYGVKINEDKGFISRSKYNDGVFKVMTCPELTRGNAWQMFENTTDLKTLIKRLIESKFEVYEFSSYQKLFKWLSE